MHTEKIGKKNHRIPGEANLKKKPLSAPDKGCLRCGTCCRKGGPAFHHEDKSLIDKGKILCEYLFTIRKGEMAWDNVRGIAHPQTSDIVKIRSREDSPACIFLDEAENACTIYPDRPLECRVLNCRDTRGIEKIYAEKRISRQDLLGSVAGLWNIIETHQRRCDYDLIRKLVAELRQGKRDGLEKTGEMILYDLHIRSLIIEKRGTEMEKMTDFLFGRPLWKTLEPMGIKIRIEGERVCIVPVY
ncbi:MAG: YkgJ family cysteine cluster protein [Desulfobacterales bacterium]